MRAFFVSSARIWSVALVILATTACSGKNIHKNLSGDDSVLQREWTFDAHMNNLDAGDHGFEFSNAHLYENTVLFGSRRFGLVSFYPKLQQVRWKYGIPNDGVLGDFAVSGQSVIFGGGDGFLHSISAETGRPNWTYEIRNPLVSKPAIGFGKVVVTTSDDVVFALNAQSGAWLWHYRRRSAPTSSIAFASSPLLDQGEAILGLSDGFLIGLGLDDGQLKWEKKLHDGRKFTDIDASPILSDGVIYIPAYDGYLYALKRSDRSTLWKFNAGGARDITLTSDRIYLSSSDGSLYAIDKASGRELWRFDCDGGVPTEVVIAKKRVIFGSSYQYFYALDEQTGKPLYRFNAGYESGFRGRPVYDPATSMVFALSGSGYLYSFRVKE